MHNLTLPILVTATLLALFITGCLNSQIPKRTYKKMSDKEFKSLFYGKPYIDDPSDIHCDFQRQLYENRKHANEIMIEIE